MENEKYVPPASADRISRAYYMTAGNFASLTHYLSDEETYADFAGLVAKGDGDILEKLAYIYLRIGNHTFVYQEKGEIPELQMAIARTRVLLNMDQAVRFYEALCENPEDEELLKAVICFKNTSIACDYDASANMRLQTQDDPSAYIKAFPHVNKLQSLSDDQYHLGLALSYLSQTKLFIQSGFPSLNMRFGFAVSAVLGLYPTTKYRHYYTYFRVPADSQNEKTLMHTMHSVHDFADLMSTDRDILRFCQ